ncbi:MAG TPA: hypothetical protein VJ550_11535 [Geomonas sp.]|nr:hypothetical protein [Geomonas sp.]
MKAKIPILSILFVLASASLAAADSYQDCTNECRSAQKQCVDAITFADEAGIKEAKDACLAEAQVCGKKCHEIDDLGVEGYQEKLRQQAEEAERKRQEQELKDSGNIRVYNGGQGGSGSAGGQDQGQTGSDGIKTYQDPQQSGGIKMYQPPEQTGGGIKTYQFDQ